MIFNKFDERIKSKKCENLDQNSLQTFQFFVRF